MCPREPRGQEELPPTCRCDVADGRRAKADEVNLPVLRPSPLGCKWKVNAVINPFLPLFFPTPSKILSRFFVVALFRCVERKRGQGFSRAAR